MIERPQSRDEALDIIWAAIRHDNEGWMGLFPDTLGCTVRKVTEITGWSSTYVRQAMEELVIKGQLSKKWNHQHQSFWSGHYKTNGEKPFGGNPPDPDVSDIPF